MSVYKVPQDVEAEDKLVGPFTLKQFIFLIVAAMSGYLTFVLATINPVLVILTLPFTIIFMVLGIYRRSDQPVEIYLASLARFYLKPRKRIWDQDGIMEPVKVTAPPKVEHYYTDGRTQDQVTSKLHGLADIMDTRGWASKNVSLQTPSQAINNSDRLLDINELPNMVQPTEIHAADDMLDYGTNAAAQTMSAMAQDQTSQMRQQAITNMQQYSTDPNDSTPTSTLAQMPVSQPAFKPYDGQGIQQKVILPRLPKTCKPHYYKNTKRD